MRSSSRGFTLLEAIVALAILAAGTLAIHAAINGALRSLERAEAAARIDTAADNALSVLESINPMTQPAGAMDVGSFDMRWNAKPIEGPTDNLTTYFQPGLYQVALYEIEVELWSEQRFEYRFSVRRAGWRQVREPVEL